MDRRSFETLEKSGAFDEPQEQTIQDQTEGSFFPSGRVTEALISKALKKLDPACNPLYQDEDDIAVARLFADVFHDVARYNVSAKAWYLYDGKVWKKDAESTGAELLAMSLSRALLKYSADIRDMRYTGFIVKLQERRRRETMIKDARGFYQITASDFDTDPYLFNVQNGVIDLATGALLEHDPQLLLSKIANVKYVPEARSPTFEKFILEVMQGDESAVDYLKRLFGYCLIGENYNEEFYLFFGATTRNGKSTLCDTMAYMFGSYAVNISPETLALAKDRNSRGPSSDIARLKGARLAHCGEPPKQMKLDTALVKALLGRDLITARNLYEAEFQFVPVFKLVMNSNYLPVVSDDTLFKSGRVKVVEFNRQFKPEEQDIHLKARLKSQDNLSGILNWCLEGLKEFREDDEILTFPASVRNATDAYQHNSDKLQLFLDDCAVMEPGHNESGHGVYCVYREWCNDNGLYAEGIRSFYNELKKKNLYRSTGTVRGQTVRNVVTGIRLSESYLFPHMPRQEKR